MQSESTYSSHMQPRTDRFEDEESSSLSDYDSEWTQVSGADEDSDYLPFSAGSERPLSRADTIDGSIDGDVWEGFVDEAHRFPSQTSEEPCPADIDATDVSSPQDEQLSASTTSRASEDEIVNDALNSSLVGTLRASRVRSATSSLHASLTESQSKLRLSFPDPLSSREDLDSDPAIQEASTPTSSVDEQCENIAIDEASSSFADIEAPSTLSVSEIADEPRSVAISIPDSASCILSLFLYGSSASSKWKIAERVMSLALRYDANNTSFVNDGPSRRYYFDSSLDGAVYATNDKSFYIRVVDRSSNFSDMDLADASDNVPSLALILLPSRLPAALPRHTYYLPLISHSSLDFGSAIPIISSAFSEQVTIDSAHYAWRKLDLPNESVIVLDEHRPQAIFDAAALESIDQDNVDKAFSGLFDGTLDHSSDVHGEERIFSKKWYKIAFVAATLLAIAVGGTRVNNMTTLSQSANSTSPAPIVNLTSSLGTPSTVATLSIPSVQHAIASVLSTTRSLETISAKSSLRSIMTPVVHTAQSVALTEVSRGALSAVVQSATTSASTSAPPNCRSKARSWANKLNLSLGEYSPRDLILRPVTARPSTTKKHLPTDILPVAGPSEPSGARSSDKPASDFAKSLSLRAVHNSLAIVSSTSKALMEVAGKDMLVLYEAIDELLRALGRQVNTAKVEMKDSKSITQTNLSSRNARAKENAKRLRRAGEQFIKAASKRLRASSEEVFSMASQVREGTKAVRQEAINSRLSRRSRRAKARQAIIDHSIGKESKNIKGRA